MNYSLIDVGGLSLSVLSYIPLILAPGIALAAVGDGWRPRTLHQTPPTLAALLAGFATLPLLDSMAVRGFGVPSALILNLCLAVAGAVIALRAGWQPRLSRTDAAALALWLLLVMAEWIDFDWGGGLRQPLLMVDLVKHAATTQAIHDTGAPPIDPFFLRPGRASYYYFFYTLSALSQQICGGLADARATVGGLVFWTGIALYALLRVMIARAAIVAAPWSRRIGLIVLAIVAIGGLDILPVLRMGLVQGVWLPDPATWNEQVTSAVESLLWVPHHVTAVIASFVGFMALSDVAPDPWRRRAVFAGACFASAFGLSVWVTFGAVATAACWLVSLAMARRWRPATSLLIAGGVALGLASFQLVDLQAGRGSGLPIAFTIRAFSPVEHTIGPGPLRLLARLVCLPINYFAEFGILASGALLFWREDRTPFAQQTEFMRVLCLAAICGLALGTFLKSTLYNNDLGWRVVLFPLLAGIVWTVAAIERRFTAELVSHRPWTLVPPLLWGLGAIGLATSLYAVVNARTFAALPLAKEMRFLDADPQTQRALRAAYGWANLHLPRAAVLQHNPSPPRVFAFGLYSRNRVGVADIQAGLYGASDAAVMARGTSLTPIFTEVLPASVVQARARANGVDALVIDSDDPVWATPTAWVWTAKPLYSTDRVRIIATTALGSLP